jgi:ParB-like chromosome segregation protein Spo0J
MCLPYEIHPIATLFPEITGNELERLADDIRFRGLHEPIVLFEGKILDGRARAQACQMRGVPIDTRHFIGSDLGAIAYVRSRNLIRRHMTPDQAKLSQKGLFKLMDCVIKRSRPDCRERWAARIVKRLFGR